MIRPVKVDEDVHALLGRLSADLRDKELEKIARLPEPRVGERYRDVLASLYRSSGSALATVWIERGDGVRRVYSFYMRADVSGPIPSFLDGPAVVEGRLVEIGRAGVELMEYAPRRYATASEMLSLIESLADLYRLSEDNLVKERALKDYYRWL